ncbi:uncharacterized protein [Rutidosis leptorrhynchoides]|uniref:uncharacterized protein n=1 Tax=Rutidosis leptorrhynchoides TaxID=125765 RepID=UPI003A990D61
MAWLKWDKVLASFDKGGLNIGSLKAFNLALIYKWRWRYLTKPNDMWVSIIKSIHGNCFETTRCSSSTVWSNIVSSCLSCTSEGYIPSDLFRMSIGDDCPVLHDKPDSWLCSISNDGAYTVKESRVYMDRHILHGSDIGTSWFKFVPHKVNVFIWRLRLECLPVRWNLSAKGLDIVSIVCPSCNNGVETCKHVFFDCNLAREVWLKVRIWLNCGLPFFDSWDSFLSWLEGVRLQVTSKNKIIAVVVTCLWVMWRFRNGLVFNDSFCSRSNLFDVTPSIP